MLDDYIIFTDLDGTLLDHNNYSFDAALEMLGYIKEKNIPLIIVTSKTKSEVEQLQKKLGIKMPFVIENGAGIFFPQEGREYEMVPLGHLYEKTRAFFCAYMQQFSMRGFKDMSTDEVMQATGLKYDQAFLAQARTFSEPFILEDNTQLDELRSIAQRDGFDIVKGGRFYHLITKGQDKAKALTYLKEYYEKKDQKSYKTIALGDSHNDVSMLKAVDIPILIPHEGKKYLACEIPNLIKAKYVGPKGWNQTLKEVLHAK